MTQRTVKRILEEAFKRILEEHNLRISTARVQWIVRTDGDAYPISFEIDGDAR